MNRKAHGGNQSGIITGAERLSGAAGGWVLMLMLWFTCLRDGKVFWLRVLPLQFCTLTVIESDIDFCLVRDGGPGWPCQREMQFPSLLH